MKISPSRVSVDASFVPEPGRGSDVVVVIDVLRMTTTAATLLSRGLAELIVVADSGAALELGARTGAAVLGERHGVALPGFHGGNSPVEHDVARAGGAAILCTSNGSRAVEAASSARHVLLGAVVNARAVAKAAVAAASEQVLLACAGTADRPSLDDVLGAGVIAKEILRLAPDAQLTDAAILAFSLVGSSEDLLATLSRARHAELLHDLGFAADIEFAARRNSMNVVPKRVAGDPATFRSA